MTSITQQKADLKDILRDIVMNRYDGEDECGHAIASGLLARLMSRMTLNELRAWHQGIAITQHVREEIKAARAEQGD